MSHEKLAALWVKAFPRAQFPILLREITSSGQTGSIGHAFVAQVWDPNGNAMITVDTTQDPAVATARAKYAAYAMTHVLRMQDEIEHLRAENRRLSVSAEYAKTLAEAVNGTLVATGKVKPKLLRHFLGMKS
jgi:hypothetical protein